MYRNECTCVIRFIDSLHRATFQKAHHTSPSHMTRKMAASKPLKYSYCGQEYQFTSKDKGYVEKLLCAICIQLLFDPVQTNCSHLICDKCLKKWKKNTCPTCQTAFSRKVPIKSVDNSKVKNLIVLCPNLPRICEWKGELGSVEAHQKDHCAYQLVQCPNKCGTAVERRELEEHKNDHCELRMYICPHCSNDPRNRYYAYKVPVYRGPYKDVATKHLKECWGYPVDCPNNCGAQGLVRGSLRPSHLAACPEQVVPCRYQTLGCKVRLARKEMRSHVEDKDSHLELAIGMTCDYKGTFTDSQQQQITTLQQELWVLLEKGGVQLPSAPQIIAKPWLKVDPSPLYPPFTVKMDVSAMDGVVDSPPFTSQPGGYRLVLRAELVICDLYDLTVIPVDCPENHSLKWPVTTTLKWVFLNQEEDKDHTEYKRTIQLNHPKNDNDVTFETPLDPLNSIHYIKVLETVCEQPKDVNLTLLP